MVFTDAVQVNPSVPLRKGQKYPFVEMQAVEPSWRDVSESERRVLTEFSSPLKKSQQCTMRVKIFVRQSHNSLILRYLKVEIPVAWNLKYSFSTAC